MFIVIEGIDGTGKSTLADGLAKALGRRATVSRPFDSLVGSIAKDLLYDKYTLSENTRLLAAAMANIHDYQFIKEDLAEYNYVIRDRYIWSTGVYQDSYKASGVYTALDDEVIRADFIIVLDAPTEEAQKRCGLDFFENVDDEVWKQRRADFLYLGEAVGPEVCAIIDATQSEEEVLAQALAAIQACEDAMTQEPE